MNSIFESLMFVDIDNLYNYCLIDGSLDAILKHENLINPKNVATSDCIYAMIDKNTTNLRRPTVTNHETLLDMISTTANDTSEKCQLKLVDYDYEGEYQLWLGIEALVLCKCHIYDIYSNLGKGQIYAAKNTYEMAEQAAPGLVDICSQNIKILLVAIHIIQIALINKSTHSDLDDVEKEKLDKVLTRLGIEIVISDE